MAIAASSVLPSNSLEDFRIEFNNLVSDVSGITAANTFDASIIFEGATADAYETTLTVTDPTADRTITLPDVAGTIITTGDTGSITSTMLASDAVTGGSIADDSIGEAKIADDAIGQDQLKSVVNLQILNSSGGVLKSLYGAGA